MAALSELIEKYTSYNYELVDFTLGTGVGRICAIRGWIPAQAGHAQDQGLIVAYLKSGVAYYRNYCLQSDGVTYLWEEEREIEELPTGLTDIALFRTNDFRVGVLGRDSAGNVHMTVTMRNWAGMSLYPETGTVEVIDMSIDLIGIEFLNTQNTETGSVEVSHIFPALCPFDYEITHEGKITGTHTAEIVFNHPVLCAGTASEYSIFNGNREVQNIGISGNKITLTLTAGSDPLPTVAEIDGNFTWLDSNMPILIGVDDLCKVPFYNLDFTLMGDPPEFTETGTVEITDISVELQAINFESAYSPTETGTVEIADITITLMDLNGDPV